MSIQLDALADLMKGVSAEELKASFFHHLKYSLGLFKAEVSTHDQYMALALAIRDRMVDRMMATEARYEAAGAKRLYYLSMEFLMGRSMGNNLINLGIYDQARAMAETLGLDLEEIRNSEVDAALGNGGLGRLAACFLDSLATLGMPGYGYGINYEYGLFKQEIANGYQEEKPDHWTEKGCPWMLERTNEACMIPLYGYIEHATDRSGEYNPMWMGWKILVGIPHDMPIVGYGGNTVNYLRLYSARSSENFDMRIFNEGDYLKAVEEKMTSETVSKVLYPKDSFEAGRELRLVQEYFFTACALRDITRRVEAKGLSFNALPDMVAIQLNDTHPSLAIAELMRFLVDEKGVPWESAWDITTRTFAFTNHTLLPEAMEKWPQPLFERVLPRHLQILDEINRRFLKKVALRWPNDPVRLQQMSLFEEGPHKQVRMAHLAMAGSHSINGVAELHTHLLKTKVVNDFYNMWPSRFNNKTNGVTQRRWLLKTNPRLADLITSRIGDAWITNLDHLRELEPYAEDAEFRQAFMATKLENKTKLAALINRRARVTVDPSSLFDIHAKRIHEYKRQLLNVMHIIHQYLCVVEDGEEPEVARTYVFAGKAAPGYWAAKQYIKLINNLARVINNDRRTRGLVKVAFIPNYRVSLAEKLIPAADLSEQISTAGMEASGTGNMKFAMNGALTIGTLDGANIEIREEVGKDNIIIFGLRAEQIENHRANQSYDPWDTYRRDVRVRRVVDTFNTDLFCPQEPGLFRWIFQTLLDQGDEYFHLADLPSYIEAQEKASRLFADQDTWARKAVLNVARIGKFSSDRTIRQYADEIWNIRGYETLSPGEEQGKG
ncbi:glycogen/starch/alpha-glucan phosphorylase [Acanthopleuribacter pedis]|uniref:Alpha-1,4 glucan phosphorylase n=1 Tax=Acanthopleuribacter pedis TaxID=442870 RepID=A0A8J7U126_9BACT|nr:glycogen/starch/alpha-glucan phosphorylase [Acanthopleuribacter pedis]MBO1317102.1 glycogen/starch/alpha-glucan phosphorylase [Acanthopleuribacter pedis]